MKFLSKLVLISLLITAQIGYAQQKSPTTIKAAVTTSHSAVLTWVAPSGTDKATAYNVYRALSLTGTFTRITTTPVKALTYTDTTVQPGFVAYYVTSLDAANLESAPSAKVSATVPGVITPPPPPPPPVATGKWTLSFTSVSFTSSASKVLTVDDDTPNAQPFTVSTTSPWIKITPLTGTTKATITIAVSSAGLAAGTYTGVVTITPTNLGALPVTHIAVTLTISGPPPATLSMVCSTDGASCTTSGIASGASWTMTLTSGGKTVSKTGVKP